MKLLKTVFGVGFQNFRKWKTDYRIWVIAALLIIMVQIYVDDMRKVAESIQTEIPIWIFPFLYSQFHTKLIFTLPLILMFCNAPFVDDNQVFVFTRTGRSKWLWGQIIYVIAASAAYYIFLLAVSLLSTVFIGDISMEWGKTLHATAASSRIARAVGSNFIDISQIILDFFTPVQAVWFTFLMSWLCGVLLGLIIFLCNMIFKTRFVGTLISSALVVETVLIENGYFGQIIPYSPVSWTTLDNIDVGGFTTNPSFGYCLSVYLITITLLSAGILILGRKQSMDVKGN